MGLQQDMRREDSAPSWLLKRLQEDTHDHLVTIAAVLWGIWFARNKRIWEGKVMSPKLAVQGSYKQINEWKDSVKKFQVVSQTRCQRSTTGSIARWKCPAVGSLKVNVDASVFPGSDSFSIGIILRDHTGMF